MASNEVEVLDPSVAIEKVSSIASRVAINRRHFMAALGAAGAAVGTGLATTGTAAAQQPVPNGYAQSDVMNFLLNVKYLKATFYAGVTTGSDIAPSFGVTTGQGGVYNLPKQVTFTGSNALQITDLFNEMYYDEVQQLVALRALLGNLAVGRATINILGDSPVDVSFKAPPATTTMTPTQAISMAQFLEDLSTSAFAGASIYLTGSNLQFAAQVLATDAFHSGAIRLLSIQAGAPYNYQGSTNFSFTAAAVAQSSTIYAFLTTPVQVGYSVTSSSTIAFAGDHNGNYTSHTAISYTGYPSAPGLSSPATVTAVGTIPSSYEFPNIPLPSSHHDNALPNVLPEDAAQLAPGMPLYDSNNRFPNPGTYIVSIAAGTGANDGTLGGMSDVGKFTIEVSTTCGGQSPGHIYIGTTPITLDAPFPSSGAFTATTIGIIGSDPMSVFPADIGPNVAKTGPTLNPAGLPKSPLNQGFFLTAGTGNTAAPAGLTFARTFGQVLTLLYGAPKDAGGFFTYEGGFYPLGVSGNINVVS